MANITISEQPSLYSLTEPSQREGTVVLEASIPKGFLDSAFDYISSHTIMRGASHSWDKTRLLCGKLSKLQQIGDIPVELRTKEGTCLSGSLFYHDIFTEKMEASGGKSAKVTVDLNHPLSPRIKPAVIVDQQSGEVLGQAARIKYSSFLDEAFTDLSSFQEFLKPARMIAVWEDSLDPVGSAPNSLLWNGSSRKQNILIMLSRDYSSLSKDGSYKVEDSSDFQEKFNDIFGALSQTEDIIFFKDEDNTFVKTLEDLKLEKSPWDLFKTPQGVFVIKKTSPICNLLCSLENYQHPLIKINVAEQLIQPGWEGSKSRGVVVLSMNQTNSYTQYTHEILTFLLSGMDVFTYDHAGKGLSVGSNSERGLLEAIYLSGLFLKETGYDESQILFKGQCAGGVPTSAAPSFFPQCHVWVDQAPSSFSRVAVKIFKEMVEEKKQNSGVLTFLSKTMKVIEPVASVLTQLVFPTIDIIKEAKKGSGLFIYSMGIPDQDMEGGDQLVPKQDIDETIDALGCLDKKTLFLPIVGGTHVTDWWIDPALHDKTMRVLTAHGLLRSNF